jgi:hypothetical protein
LVMGTRWGERGEGRGTKSNPTSNELACKAEKGFAWHYPSPLIR